MSRHLGLLTRVRRLEKQRRSRRSRRVVLYARYADDQPDDRVTGIDGINAPVAERRWGEAITALISRARAGTGPRNVLLCRYPSRKPAEALCEAPSTILETTSLPVFDRHAPDPVKRWREFNERNNHEAVD